LALRNDAHAICEKPIVLNPWNIDALKMIEKESGKKVFTILQVRLHPAIMALKKRVMEGPDDKMYNLDLTYFTSRGKWYFRSWKGDTEKSGGIATNIGIHFFDLLTWIFGKANDNIVHVLQPDRAAGFLKLEKANIRWFLSLNFDDIPENVRAQGKRTYRSLLMDGEEIEFSDGFTDLHTESYKQIIAGKGFGLLDTKPSVEIAHDIRVSSPIGLQGDYHPLLKNK
jgi:UDP-N-acetyl-2-amino-2-deoxyglucuronate dehydrogenase